MLGWPVAHSLSPRIQNAALAQAGLSGWRYQLLPVPPDLFAETVPGLRAAGFRGANVTIPHKQAALALADAPSPRAAAIGAANTLLFTAAGIEADNTDAPALIDALPVPAAGARAIVLGAGGSARAAIWALANAGAAEILIWNRTPARAAALAAELGGTAVNAAQLGAAPGTDLLINCTAVGLDGSADLGPLPLGPGGPAGYGAVVDFVYRPGGTALIEAARAANVPAVGGLELLVGQGALAFEQFTGRPAPVPVMRAAAGLDDADGYIRAR